MDEQEITDLETARLALHGLLAQNRNMQALNERLKGEMQEAAHREKLAQQKAADAQAEMERIQAAGLDRRAIREKDKELAHLREEVARFERMVQELRQQSDAAQLRSSAQLADVMERARLELQNAVELAVQDKDALLKGMQLYSSQQIAELKARCEALEREAAEKEHALTQEFHERNKSLAGQWKSREESLWEQTRNIQEKLESEMRQRLELHLASIHQERRKEKADYDQKLIELDEHLARRKEQLRAEYEAREKEIRAVYEHNEADMQRRLAERAPSEAQQVLREKAALERQMQDVEAQWLRREAAVREEYANLESQLRRLYEKRETEIRAEHHGLLAGVESDWADRVNKLQAEFSGVLSNERKKAAVQAAALRQEMEQQRDALMEEAAHKEHQLRDHHAAAVRQMAEDARQAREELLHQFQSQLEAQNKKHAALLMEYGHTVAAKQRAEAAQYETRVTELQVVQEQRDARIKVLEAELERAAAEHARLLAATAAHEQEWATREAAAQDAIRRMEEAHREQLAAVERGVADKEHLLSARLRAELERQEAAFAARMLDLGKSAEINLQKLRDDYLARERALNARSADLHKRDMEVLAAQERLQHEARSMREDQTKKSDALLKAEAGLEEQRAQLKRDEEALQRMVAKAQAMEAECRAAHDQLLADFAQGVAITPASTQTLQSMLEEGIFGFAHQIRNPLAIIRSITETIGKEGAGADKKSVEWMLQAVDGLTRRLEEFTAFSKPIDLSFSFVNMNALVRSALVPFQGRAVKQRVQIQTDLPESLPEMSGNAEHFQTVIAELVTNALDAMPNGGVLHVTTRHDPQTDTVQLKIQDGGIGIASARLSEVGKPFFTTKANHSGLGLARARRILHLYAGQFAMESESGQGATVTCTFRRKGWAK